MKKFLPVYVILCFINIFINDEESFLFVKVKEVLRYKNYTIVIRSINSNNSYL